MSNQLRALTDRADITSLVDRWLASLDDRRFDAGWARSMFTEDIRSEDPMGEHVGIAGHLESMRKLLVMFERTQHVGMNHIIDLDGDVARVRWNSINTHVLASQGGAEESERLFTSGGHFDADVVRTAEGWRFQRMSLHVTWTSGEPPVLPADA
ncbi:nuclear transport factor 2 family protein [Nocardiopsis gilva]